MSGPGKGMACVFPFTFDKVTYDKCQYYLGQPACATEVDDHGHAKDYGYCGPNCPITGQNDIILISGFQNFNFLLNTILMTEESKWTRVSIYCY